MQPILRTLVWLAIFLVGEGLHAWPAVSWEGQASAHAAVNQGEELPLWLGARYIPRVNIALDPEGAVDLELSATIHGGVSLHPCDSTHADGTAKPYRAWIRYAAPQMDLRLGLQKINFGSASLIRPLMWFDRVDSRDPLQLTDGLWGLLGRYFFMNNANVWLWGLWGNEKPKAWELCGTAENTPEFGGRVQIPVPRGEAAMSFHRRMADLSSSEVVTDPPYRIPENRVGIDVKVDVEVGLWLEGVVIAAARDIGPLTNLNVVNLGVDYTFELGNGLHAQWEQVALSFDRSPVAFATTTHLSAASLSYPMDVRDRIAAIVYRDWTAKNTYAFVHWHRELTHCTLHLVAFWNPRTVRLPHQTNGSDMLAGRGFQVMAVVHH